MDWVNNDGVHETKDGLHLSSDDGVSVYCDAVLLQNTTDGKIQASRSQADKERNPDRISLDRRGLTKFPQLSEEPRLRLLSLQHNLISRVDSLADSGLSKLVFLDMYDNQLEKISGLESLENLRVLLMGKNRIRRIEGLNNLVKLEVLDLHGNQIYQVGGLSSLNELKVLNLAGNQIRVIGATDLNGLGSLQELNLRRNRLKRLLGFGETIHLRKLFLSNNDLQQVEDMNSVVRATELEEVTIDGNPVALGGDCVSFLVSYLPTLKFLSHMEVTESVRKAAMSWRKNKEASDMLETTKTTEIDAEIKREQVISNARTNWELLRSQTRIMPGTNSLCGSLRDLRFETENDVTHERCVQSDSGISVGSSSNSSYFQSVNHNVHAHPLSAAEIRRQRFSRKTCSQDSEFSQTTNSSSGAASIEFFKLPPIFSPLLSGTDNQQENLTSQSGKESDELLTRNDSLKRYDSLSSVEPNVDSSVSSFPSDTSSSSEEQESSEEAVSASEVQCRPGDVTSTTRSSTHCQKHTGHRAHTRVSTARNRLKFSALPGKIREQGGDYLIEISGQCLNVYGQGALRFIDRPWNSGKAAEVYTVKFNYINFNHIISVFGRLKQRFQNVENFVFQETNIHCLGQINALADVQGLTSLHIESEGNPITQKDWIKYAIYRLSHWGLKVINGKEVKDEDIAEASEEFQGLSDIILWSLPESLLQPLLGRLQITGTQQQHQQMSAKQWLWTADPALRSVVGKEALQWRRSSLTQEDVLWRHRGRVHLAYLLEVACAAVEKLHMLEAQWPSILAELVRDTLVDYSHLDSYMKQCMQKLKV
ncbi:leucine-rich repeat-containing protein 49 isoform X1 [Schistocerca gregaria]|uniref:leucine-rich repeat-containing protein 49 isoform X1 n=1 Tax=Schistocerca gregaria TaxID=7010 RepID=UPI00211DF71A|nr:leucine-rich repeat-containing protein 49 isoform X1 [Schistocerca gregaria]